MKTGTYDTALYGTPNSKINYKTLTKVAHYLNTLSLVLMQVVPEEPIKSTLVNTNSSHYFCQIIKFGSDFRTVHPAAIF